MVSTTATGRVGDPRAPVAPAAIAVRSYALVAFAVSLVILVLRYPTALFAAEPLWEDGPVFYLGGFDGLGSLARPYQGYLHLAPRLVSIAATAVPPALVPVFMNGVTILVTAGVAAFIASGRLRTAVPDPRLRLALAIGFVLMPAAQELSWHLLYIQWSLAFFLLARVIADEPGPRWIWLDRAAVAAVGLTGPFSILFAPLYIWRRRRLGMVTWIVVACGAIQLVVVATTLRSAPSETSLGDAVAILATRLFAEPLLGYRLTWTLSEAGIPLITGAVFVAAVVALLLIAGSVIPRRILAVLVYAAVVVAIAGVIRSADGVWTVLAGWGGGRYFLFGIAAITAITITAIAVGAKWQRRAGLILAMLLSIGVIWDFRILPPPIQGWAERSSCIGASEPCVVPVFPGGAWDIRWPGR